MKKFITTSIAAFVTVAALATEGGLKVGMYKVKGTETDPYRIKVFVDAKGKSQVKIKDAQGRAYSNQTLKGSDGLSIDLSAAPAGNYSIEVTNGTELITKMITKK